MAFNFINFGVGESQDLKYTGFLKNVGAFKKTVHCFVDRKNIQAHIWGSSVLNTFFYGVPFGTWVTIKYLGKYVDETTGSKHAMHQYDFEIKDITPVIPRRKKKPKVEKIDVQEEIDAKKTFESI